MPNERHVRTVPTGAFLADDGGATAIEYGLIAALISIIIISGLLVLGAAMDTMYESVTNAVDGAMN
jgi:pilus assembly protein Flp/PilA